MLRCRVLGFRISGFRVFGCRVEGFRVYGEAYVLNLGTFRRLIWNPQQGPNEDLCPFCKELYLLKITIIVMTITGGKYCVVHQLQGSTLDMATMDSMGLKTSQHYRIPALGVSPN